MARTIPKKGVLFHLAATLALVPLGVITVSGIILVLILHVFRRLHVAAAVIFRPDLKGILPPIQNLFAMDKLDSPTCNICVVLIFDGNMRLELLQDSFLEKVLRRRLFSGKLQYPELRRYWTAFGGYMFWKDEENFDINGHVRLVDSSDFHDVLGAERKPTACYPLTEDDLKEVFTTLQVKSWKSRKSPWELVLAPHYRPDPDGADKTAIVFRIHHTLGDGYGIQKLLLTVVSGEMSDILEPLKPRTVSLPSSCKSLVTSVYQIAFEVLDFVANLSLDRHDWMGPAKCDVRSPYCTTWTRDIPISRIKSIKKRHGTSFNSVIISVVLATFKKMVADAGLKCPEGVTMFLPVPMPNRPAGLGVHTSCVMKKFYLGYEQPAHRLKSVDLTINSIGRRLPAVSYVAFKTYAMFPSIVLKGTKVVGCTVGFTCIPGPPKACYVGLHRMESVFSNFPMGPGRTDREGGCTITAFTCMEQMKIVITSTTQTWPFPPSLLKEKFDRYIQEEIESFNFKTEVQAEVS